MILFTSMLVGLLSLVVIAALVAVMTGGAFIFVFGDVIVFVGIIWLLTKLFGKTKKGS